MAKAGKKGKKKGDQVESEANPKEKDVKKEKKGKKKNKKDKKNNELQKEKSPKGKPSTPPLKKCLIAPDVEIEYIASQKNPASKMDFQQYFRFLTHEILAQLHKNQVTLDAEKGVEYRKTNFSDLSKNLDVLKIVMNNLKRLLTQKKKGLEIFKYICYHLTEILEDVKKMPRCVRSEPDFTQFYRSVERNRANKCLKGFFNFPHKRDSLNVVKAWSSPRLLVPQYSLFEQIDKVTEDKKAPVAVNLANEKSTISLAVGEYLFNEQLPQGFIDRFTIFTYEDLDVLMKAPRVFAEELLSIILKQISIKDTVRRYTVDLLMSCINFALNQMYDNVQLSICLTSFLIAHYYYLKHRYDNFDSVFEAFFVNFAYMNYQASKFKCRTFTIIEARDVINCFVKLYMQQLPLIASLLHETKKLIIADFEAETNFSDEHSSLRETKGAVETLGAPLEEWSVFHNLPIFTDFDPNRFIKFKKSIKKIKYQQDKERKEFMELGSKRRSKFRTNLRKKLNKSHDYFIEIFCAFLNDQNLLNDMKYEPLKEHSFKQMWTESTSTLATQLSRLSDSITSKLSFWRDPDGKYLHFLFDHFANEQTDSTIVLWGSGETTSDLKTTAGESQSFISGKTAEPFEDFFRTANDEEASTVDYSCTKLCEHQPFHFNKLLLKFIKEFKLIGPTVEEETYLEDDRKHVDIFTMIEDLPMYGKVLRTAFYHPKKKRFVNYNSLRNLGHLLDEIYSNKYICAEKKLIVYDNLKRYFHNFRKKNKLIGPTIWHDPLVNCGLDKYENILDLKEDLFDLKNYYNYFDVNDVNDVTETDNLDDTLTYPKFLLENLILEEYFKTCNHYLNNDFDVLKDIKINKVHGKIKYKYLETSSDDNIDQDMDKYKIILNRKNNKLFKLNLLNNMYNTIGEHTYFNRDFVVKNENIPKDIEKYIVHYNKRHSITPDDDYVCAIFEQSFDLLEELDEFYGGEQYDEEVAVEENNSDIGTETSMYNYYFTTDKNYLKKEASQFQIFNRPQREFYSYTNELMLRLYKEESRLDDVQLYNLNDYRLIDMDVFDPFDFDNEQCMFYDIITPTTKQGAVCKENEPSCKIIDSHFYEFKTKEEESIRWRHNENIGEESVTKEYLNTDPSSEDYMFYKIPKRKIEDFSDDIITWIFVDVVEGANEESAIFFDHSKTSCLFGDKKIKKPKRKRRVGKGIRYSNKENVIDMPLEFEDCMKSCTDPNKFITDTIEQISLVDRNKCDEIEVPDVELPDKFYTAVQSYEIAKLKMKVILHLMKTDKIDCAITRTISLPTILYRTFNDFIENRIKLPRRCYSMETLYIPQITILDELKHYKEKVKKSRLNEIDYEKIDKKLKELQAISDSDLVIKSTIFDTKPTIKSDSWSNVILKIKKGLLIDDILTKDDNLFKIKNITNFLENIDFNKDNLDYTEFWENYLIKHQSKLIKKKQVIEKKEAFKRRPLYYNEKVEKIKKEGDLCKEYLKSIKQIVKQKQVKPAILETQSELIKRNFDLYDKLLEEELNALCGQQDSTESQVIIKEKLIQPAAIDNTRFKEVICNSVLNYLSNENLIDTESEKEPKTVLERVIENYTQNMQSQNSNDAVTLKKQIYDQFYKNIKPILIKSKIQTEIFNKYSIIKKIIREYINNVIRSYEENLTGNQNKLPTQECLHKINIEDYPVISKKLLLKPKFMAEEEAEVDEELSIRLQEKSVQVDIESTISTSVNEGVAESTKLLSEVVQSKLSICESDMETVPLPQVDKEFSKSDIIWLRKNQMQKFCKSDIELLTESEIESEYTATLESYTQSGDETVQMYGYRSVMSPFDEEADNILSTPALINVTKKGSEIEIDITDESELSNDYFKDGNEILDYDLKNIDRSGAYRSKRYLLIPGQEGDENMLILQMYPSWMTHVSKLERQVGDVRQPFTNKPTKITDALGRLTTDSKSFGSLLELSKEQEVTPTAREDSRDTVVEVPEKSTENLADQAEDAYVTTKVKRKRRRHSEKESLDKLLQKIEFKNVKDDWLKELKRELLKEVLKNKQSPMMIEHDEDVEMYKLLELSQQEEKFPDFVVPVFVQEEAEKSPVSVESTISYDYADSKDDEQVASTGDKADKTEDVGKKGKSRLERKLNKKLMKMKESDFKIILEQLYYFKHKSKYLPYEELIDIEGQPTIEDIVKTKDTFEEFIRNVAKTLKIPQFLDKTQIKKFRSNFERFGPIYKYDILTRELRQKYSIEELDLEEFDQLKFDYFNVNDIIEIFFGKVAGSAPEDSVKDYELKLLDTLVASSDPDVLHDTEMIKFIDDIDEELIDNYLEKLSYDENLWEIIDDYLKIKQILKENLSKTKLNPCDELKLMEMHDKNFRRSSTLHDRKSMLSIASCEELLKLKRTGGREVGRKSLLRKQRKSVISTESQKPIKERTMKSQEQLLKQIIEQKTSKKLKEKPEISKDPLENYEKIKEFIHPIQNKKIPVQEKKPLYKQNLDYLTAMHDQLYQILTTENQILQKQVPSLQTDKITNFRMLTRKSRAKIPNLNRNFDRQRELEAYEVVDREKKKRVNKTMKVDRKYFNLQQLPRNF